MLRLKPIINRFIQNNKYKIIEIGKRLIIVAIVIFIATIMLSITNDSSTKDEEDTQEVYRPTETIITGNDLTDEQYTSDNNIINKFLDFCNSGNTQEAYALLSSDCKEELYPTLESFEKYYHSYIFNIKREYNLQSWISTSEYTVYRIRYPNSMLSTGTYNEEDVYRDYITLNKNSDKEEISISGLVNCKLCNILTSTDEIDATVIKKKIYMDTEDYEIEIKNKTDKTILLDPLNGNNTLNIRSGKNSARYGAHQNKLFTINLIINPGETKIVDLKFKKSLGLNNKSNEIEFLNIIKDYYTYIQDRENYTDKLEIVVNLEE